MKVSLSHQLFEKANLRMDLLSLIALGANGQHCIITDPVPDVTQSGFVWHDSIAACLSKEHVCVREALETAVAHTLGQEAIIESLSEIVVSDEGENWSLVPPKISTSSALLLLKQPLKIMVEHRLNDRAFFMAMIADEYVKAFLELEESKCVEFEHAGGITQMPQLIEACPHGVRARRFVFCDSDSLSPGEVSRAAKEVGRACRKRAIPVAILKRRAIENYVPISALNRWAHTNIRPTLHLEEKKRRVEALKRLEKTSALHRHHYNMKNGFSGDEGMNLSTEQDLARTQFLGSLSIDPTLKGDLARGIHPDIADLFSGEEANGRKTWFTNEDSDGEIRAIAQTILKHR